VCERERESNSHASGVRSLVRYIDFGVAAAPTHSSRPAYSGAAPFFQQQLKQKAKAAAAKRAIYCSPFKAAILFAFLKLQRNSLHPI